MTNQHPEWLPIGEVARLLNVSVDTIRRWEGEGKIEATRTPGQQRRFARAEVDRLATAAHEIGLGIPAEPLFRSRQGLNAPTSDPHKTAPRQWPCTPAGHPTKGYRNGPHDLRPPAGSQRPHAPPA